MAGFTPELKQRLSEHGCRYVKPGKGDHEIWYSPVSRVKFTVDHNIKSRHTANKCLKDAGIYSKQTRFG